MMMKHYLIFFILLFLFACAKEKPEELIFDASANSLTVKAGSPVTFQFKGNADNIVFYSGEPGSNYQFRKRIKAENKLLLNFSSFVQAGLIYPNLSVLVAADYSGKADSNSVKAANWMDITNRAIFSTGTDNTPSGQLDLTDLIPADPNIPVWVAFRYMDYKKTKGQNRWYIRSFDLSTKTPEGAVTNLASLSTAGWIPVNFKNSSNVWTVSATQLMMYGGSATSADNEDWVIAKGVYPLNVQPDKGVGIKNISRELYNYEYVYNQPGVYKVVFESSSVWFNAGESKTVELSITVVQ